MKSVLGTVCLAMAVAIAVLLCWQVAGTQEFSMLFAGESQQLPQPADQRIVASEPGVQAPTARIMQLPNDGQAWHLSLCLSDNWQNNPREREIRDWFFDANLQLTSLRVQTQFHQYTPRHGMFRALLAHRIPAVPAIVLQDASGYVVYASCESQRYQTIPLNGDDLAYDIADRIAARCVETGLPASECDRCRPRPRPEPRPGPNVDVHVNVTKPIVPKIDVDVRGRQETKDFPWGLLAAVLAVVALASIAYNFRREVSSH